MRVGVLAGLGLLLSASLVTTAYLLDRRDATVPWRELPITEANLGPPTPAPPPIPAGTRTCTGRRALVETSGPQPLNSATTMYWVGLRNTGSESCVVRAHPTARAASGRVRIRAMQRASAFVLAPGSATGAGLAVGTCGHERSNAGDAALRVGYGTRTARLRIPACSRGAQTLIVSPFEAPPPPEPKLERFPLHAELRVPRRAVLGSTLRFRVAIENTSAKPFRFPYCPVFEAGVMGAARFAAPLNCDPVGRLEPGDEVVFDLLTPLREDARPGRYEVYWYLNDATVLGDLIARDAIELLAA